MTEKDFFFFHKKGNCHGNMKLSVILHILAWPFECSMLLRKFWCTIRTCFILPLDSSLINHLLREFNAGWNLENVGIKLQHSIFCAYTLSLVGRDSAGDIANSYGLDGPGFKSQWWPDFPQLPRTALGPTQPPIQWVPGVIPGGKVATVW